MYIKKKVENVVNIVLLIISWKKYMQLNCEIVANWTRMFILRKFQFFFFFLLKLIIYVDGEWKGGVD